MLLLALSTGHKLGLGLAGAAFAGFALVVSMLVPRYRPQFPGRRLWIFVAVSFMFFIGMLAAVEIFGKSSESEAAASNKVTVTEVEYEIQMPKTTLTAGRYEFEVENQGKIPHNLTIAGPSGTEHTQDIAAGTSSTLTVELKSGSYDFYCSLPGHKAQGMDQKVTVS